MATVDLTTYTGLLGSIAAWLNREDLTPIIPTLVSLTEVDLNSRLRCQQMVVSKTAPSNDNRYPLPSDWLEAVTIEMDGYKHLKLVSPGELRTIRDNGHVTYSDGTGEEPTSYALYGGFINLGPGGVGAVLDMAYYARIPALTADNPVNWLLRDRPDAYLYGALTHAAPYLVEDERTQTWLTFYQNAVSALNKADESSRYSGGPLTRRNRGF